MKDKNLSLARKVLLALLAVLMAVGAFFGVASLKRGGLVSSVEGALTASADEEITQEQLNKYKEEALFQLTKGYEDITGNTVTFDAKDSSKVTGPTADVAALQNAVNGINDAIALTSANNDNSGINEVVKTALSGFLQKAYTNADSATIRTYMSHDVVESDDPAVKDDGGIIEQFNALYATDTIRTVVIDADVLLSNTNEEGQSVATYLQTTRTNDYTGAANLFAKVKTFLGIENDAAFAVKDTAAKDATCTAVNAALESAFEALLTTTDENLTVHYTELSTAIAAVFDGLDEVVTKEALFDKVVLVKENARLKGSKTQAATDLEGYLSTLGVTDITLGDLSEATFEGEKAKTTVPAALAEVNKALKDAVISALLSMVDEATDTTDVVKIVTDAKEAVEAVTTVNAYTGLSSLSDAIENVASGISHDRGQYIETAKGVYKAFYKALTGGTTETVGEKLTELDGKTNAEKQNISAINNALQDDIEALVGTQYAKDESGKSKDSTTVATAIDELLRVVGEVEVPANEILTFGTTEAEATGEIVAKIDAFQTAKATEKTNIINAYKAAYETEAFGNEDWDETTSVPEGITDATNTAALNTALTAAVSELFNSLSTLEDSDELTQVLLDAMDAIEKLSTDANATEGHPTLLTIEGLMTEVNAQLAKIALQTAVDEAKAELMKFADSVGLACHTPVADWDETVVPAACKLIQDVTTTDAIPQAFADAKDALLTAAKNEIAKKQYSDSYHAIYGEAIPADDLATFAALLTAEGANANDVLKNAIVGTDGLIEKAVAALKTAVAAEDTRCLTAREAELKGKVTAVKAGEGVYVQVYNYAEALEGAKAALDFAQSQDEAIKSVATQLKTLEGTWKAQMDAADWTALEKLAEEYKAEIAALTSESETAPAAKAIELNGKLAAQAYRYSATREYKESIKAVTDNDPSADLLSKFVKDIAKCTTIQDLNKQLKESVSADIKALYADDSAAVNAKVQYCLDKIQGNGTDVIEDVSAVFADADDAEGPQALSSEISNARGAEMAAALQLYKDVYEGIHGPVADWTDENVPAIIKSARNCKELNDRLAAEIGTLLDALLAAHENDSTAVKNLITGAKTEITGKFEEVNGSVSTRKLPDGVPAIVTTLMSAITKQVDDEKAAAQAAYEAFYLAVKGVSATDPDLTELKAALDAAKDCTGFNAALQEAMKGLVDTFAAAQIETAKEENTVLDTVVTDLDADIDEAFTELTAVLDSEVATTLGGKVKVFVNFELDRVAAVKKVDASYKAATALYDPTALSAGGAKALADRKGGADAKLGTLEEGPGSIKVTENVAGWDAAYAAAKAELDAVITDLKIEAKNTANFDVFSQIVTNAVAEQLYIDSYIKLMHAESVPETDTFTKDNLNEGEQAYEKAKTVITLNTSLVDALKKLLDTIAVGQTAETATKIGQQKATFNDVVFNGNDIGKFPAAANTIVTAIDALIQADVNAIIEVYKAAYAVFKGEGQTPAEGDLTAFNVRSCAAATAALSTKLAVLVGGLNQDGDSETVTSFITAFGGAVTKYITDNNTTLLAGFASTVEFTINGGTASDSLYTLAEAVAEVATLRGNIFGDIIDAYIAAYKAATDVELTYNAETKTFTTTTAGHDLTKANEAAATIMGASNISAANKALKGHVRGLIGNLILAGDSHEVELAVETAQGQVDKAEINEKGVSTTLTDIVTAVRTEVEGLRAKELQAAKDEYEAVYTQLTGVAATDTATVFLDTLKTAKDWDDALKAAVKALLTKLQGYDATNDAAEITTYLTGEGEDDAKTAIGAVKADDNTGISDLTDAVDAVIAAVDAMRAAEKVKAINEYLTIYNIIKGTKLTYPDETAEYPEAVTDFVSAINAEDVVYAADMNTALKAAVTALVGAYVTDGDSAAAAAALSGEYAATIDAVVADDDTGISALSETVNGLIGPVDTQRNKERTDAKELYLSFYNAFMGTKLTLESAEKPAEVTTALKALDDAVDMQGFNDVLKTEVGKIKTAIAGNDESQAVKDYAAKLGSAIEAAIENANDTTEGKRPASPDTDKLTIGEEEVTLEAAANTLAETRGGEAKTAVDAYLEAYKLITGTTISVGDDGKVVGLEGEALATAQKNVDDIKAAKDATAINTALKAAVNALVTALKNNKDSNAVDTFLTTTVVTAVTELGTVEGKLVVIDKDALSAVLTFGEGEDKQPLNEHLAGMRAKEIKDLQAAYKRAYELLTGYTVEVKADGTITITNDEKTVEDAVFTDTYEELGAKTYFKEALPELSNAVVAVMKTLYDAKETGSAESNAIYTYMKGATDAVKAAIDNLATAPDFGSLTFGELGTLAQIKASLTAKRAAEKTAAENAYKAAYAFVKGSGEPAADDATMKKLVAGMNATELNAAVKEGVKALVEGLLKTDENAKSLDSNAVKTLVTKVVGENGTLAKAFERKETFAVVTDTTLTGALQLVLKEGEEAVTIMQAIANQRKADVADAVKVYLNAYKALRNEEVTENNATEEIGKQGTFVEANNLLKTYIDTIILAIRTEHDSENVKNFINAVKKALWDAIDAANASGDPINFKAIIVTVEGETPEGTKTFVVEDTYQKLAELKANEFVAAKLAYLEAYNAVTGEDLSLDDEDLDEDVQAVLDDLDASANIEEVNGKLVGYVQDLTDLLYKATEHTPEVNHYLTADAGTFGDGEPNAKRVIEAADKLANGLQDVVGAVEAVIARVEQFRVDELELVVDEYLYAYTLLVDKDANEDTEAVAQFKTDVEAMTTPAANTYLLAEVNKLLASALTKAEGESKTITDLLAEHQDNVSEVAANENTGVSELSKGTVLTTAKSEFADARLAEKKLTKDAYLKAYELLMGKPADKETEDDFDGELGIGDLSMKELIGILATQVGLIVQDKMTLKGDSANVKAFLEDMQDAVETAINELTDLTGYDIETLKVERKGGMTLTQVRESLDEMRAEERNAGKDLYKKYYAVIKGETYSEAYATDADKKVLTDIEAAADNTAVNTIIYNAVVALINNWHITDADGENVKKVATDLENALHDKFNTASSEDGELAKDLEADITAILVAIDLRREQDTTIGEVNAAYDAIEAARLEAAAKAELDTLKTDALAAIEEVTLGNGGVAEAAKTLDGILATAIDALNRKAAEGIAKQEYLDSYKNITGADATDTEAVFTAITAAAAQSGYTAAVNTTLQSAVETLLDNVLVRDSKNVLKDSQETKAIVEAAKKAVAALQGAKGVPDVSEAVKNVKTDVDAQRTAEKDAALAAIDALVEGKTYSDTVKAVLDLATLTATAKAKVENGNYAELSAAVQQLTYQVRLVDVLAELEEMDNGIFFADMTDVIQKASQAVGATTTVADTDKVYAREALNVYKAYAKLELKDLVKDESDTVKDSVLNEYNAKIDSATDVEKVVEVYEEAQLAIAAGRFFDSYSVLRKAFASIGAGDKAALEAALVAFKNLDAESDAKVYLNGKTRYSSYEDEIADMIAKAEFEEAKAEAIEGVKALAASKTGSYMQKVANSQIAKLNALTYQPQTNAANRNAYLQQQKDAAAKVLNETSGKLESAQTVQNAENKMNGLLDEYLASGNYQGKTKDNLASILETYLDRAEEEGVTEAELDALYNEAKAALDAANVSTVASGVALENGEYAEDYKGNTLYGTVTSDSDSGLAKSTTVAIEQKDGSLTMDTIKDAAANGKLKAAAGTTLTEDEMKALVDGKEIITTLDISLSATAEGGLYTVRVLLPEDLRNVENIAVVYATADGSVEVFNAQLSEDGYLTFTTDHFSEFVLIGEGSVNLWWLVITLTVVLALELVALLVVLLKKNKKSSTTAASVLPLGLLALVIPMNATGICILLGVCVVGLGVGIFFAARHKKKANQK